MNIIWDKGLWTGIMLACGSISDLKRKRLPGIYLALCGVICITLSLHSVFAGGSVELPGIIPGMILLLAGRLTGGCIGAADGIMMVLLGLLYGLTDSLRILMIAFLIGGITAFVLIAFRIAGKKSRMPFYPFLFAGFILCSMING